MDPDVAERFERVVQDDGRYPLDAFAFLYRGLDQASRARHGDEPPSRSRHVTGQELCQSLRQLAVAQWGPLARLVLERWNIRRTRDFGEMVFLLVQHELMGKQDSDRLEDFDDVYDFREAFGHYEIPLGELAE
jgi:uncharacterized repeat protein (TIGR04138 family)